MNPELEALLADFGAEDAEKIRAAVTVEVAPVETPAPATPVEPAVDVATEVTRQVAPAIEAMTDLVASAVEAMTAPVVESNDEDTASVVDDVVNGVKTAFEERFTALEAAVEEQRSASTPGALAGGKPIEEIKSAAAAVDEDLERMAKDPQTAPGILSRALARYAETHGAYIPHDAPRVNVAPEHLQVLQAARVPGEDFHFDFE